MALRYPFLMIALLAAALLVIVAIVALVRRRKEAHRGGVRVANTRFARSLPAVRNRQRRQKLVFTACQVVLALALAISSVLAARPSAVVASSDAANRKDIMLCLDVSASICDMNYDIVDTLENVVGHLGGERFGITIYNTSAVLYVPLTDDYEYVQDALEDLKGLFKAQAAYMDYDIFGWSDADTEALWYFQEGTVVGSEEKGSSLIGEGLASAMYSFPGLGEQNDSRTRLIIMSTDNAEEQGETPPLIRFPEAAAKCAENGIKVIGIFPSHDRFYLGNTVSYTTAIEEFKNGIEQTGGRVYQISRASSASDIVLEINSEEAKLVDSKVRLRYEDQPQAWYAALAILIASFFVARAVSRS